MIKFFLIATDHEGRIIWFLHLPVFEVAGLCALVLLVVGINRMTVWWMRRRR